MNGFKISLVTAVTFCILISIVTQASAGFSDGIGMQTNIKSLNGPMNMVDIPLPLEVHQGDDLMDLKGFQRKMINSLPDPAMEYNALSAIEDLYKYQTKAIQAGSLLTGSISLPSLIGLSFDMPYSIKPMGLDMPKLNPVSTVTDHVRNSALNEIEIMKNDLLEQKFNLIYQFRDYGISGNGKMIIDQKWTPGRDFGTMTKNIKSWSNYHTRIPDPGFTRSFNYKINQIPSTNYRTSTYSNINSFNSFP